MKFPPQWQNHIAKLRRTPGLVTRFAPSPTGYLHMGHVVNMIFVWGVARSTGAQIILRVEDHDRGRCRPEYEIALFEDLAWLGFTADLGMKSPQERPSPFRQSDSRAAYDSAHETLRRNGFKVYFCSCSRKDLTQRQNLVTSDELRYDNHCRDLSVATSTPHGVRVALTNEVVEFNDLWMGQQRQNPMQQCGDLLLRDRDGFDTYQAAVVVDDIRHNVNLVIRGQDLTASTGRQILLARMLHHDKTLEFLHHPLLTDQDGRKLSKRQLATAIAARRQQGDRAGDILGEAAYLVGLLPEQRFISANEAMELVAR